MKKFASYLILFFVIAVTGPLHSQILQYLDANNINAGIGIGGNLFSKVDSISNFYSTNDTLDNWLLFEAPKGSKIKDIYTGALWMGALDSVYGDPHCAMQYYKANGPDYYDGPIASVYNTDYDNYYKRVFKVTRSQIIHFRNLAFPTTPDLVDSALLQWPGKGNPFVANSFGIDISSSLAPFIDADHDGVYNPLNGDYPAICGDQAIFFVFNDVRGPHHETNTSNPLGFEIHGMAYEFTDSSSVGLSYQKRAVNNTVFISYDIENKSKYAYYDFYLALWEDPDLGCFDNDRVGCDTDRNLMFVYNGTVPDPDCGNEYGYGYTFASHGVKILNHKMSAFGYSTNGASFGDPNTSPLNCYELRDYLQGFWIDGTPFTEGGTGYNSSNSVTKFIFPSDPNDPSGWSEVAIANLLSPGDRRMWGSIGPMNYAIGETKHFDFAFTTSYDKDTTTNMFKVVDTLKRDADIVQQYYNNQIVPCRNELIAMGIKHLNPDELSVAIYPNPSNHQITIETAEPLQWFEVTDVEGRLINRKNTNEAKNTIDVTSFAKGVYLLKLASQGKFAIKKIVVD